MNMVSHGSLRKTIFGNPGWSGKKNFDGPQKVAQRANTEHTVEHTRANMEQNMDHPIRVTSRITKDKHGTNTKPTEGSQHGLQSLVIRVHPALSVTSGDWGFT